MQNGLRYREATAFLKMRRPAPVAHGLHSQQRWARQAVLDFCAKLQNPDAALGEGCVRGGSSSTAVTRTS